MVYAIALAAITLFIFEILALIGIWFRYAIPKAPKVFHVMLAVPMVLAAVSGLCIGWIGLAPEEGLWGFPLRVYRFIHFSNQALTFGILVGYAVYYHLRGRRCPV